MVDGIRSGEPNADTLSRLMGTYDDSSENHEPADISVVDSDNELAEESITDVMPTVPQPPNKQTKTKNVCYPKGF